MKHYLQKVTREQRHELLQIYLNMGLEVSRVMCVEYGVHPDYAAKRASELGLSHRKRHTGSGRISSRIDHSDHRWSWAIQRGGVVV